MHRARNLTFLVKRSQCLTNFKYYTFVGMKQRIVRCFLPEGEVGKEGENQSKIFHSNVCTYGRAAQSFMVRTTSADLGLHAGNMKFRTKN